MYLFNVNGKFISGSCTVVYYPTSLVLFPIAANCSMTKTHGVDQNVQGFLSIILVKFIGRLKEKKLNFGTP